MRHTENFKNVTDIDKLSEQYISTLHMFNFDKMNIQKTKYDHERIHVIIFDDIIETNNAAFRSTASVLQTNNNNKIVITEKM